MKNPLPYKGYARIYVETKEDALKVHGIIKELDAYEYEYMPDNLIALFGEYPNLVYTHKFSDLCMNRLQAVCWSRGVKIFVASNGHDEVMENHLVKYCKKCGTKMAWDSESCEPCKSEEAE